MKNERLFRVLVVFLLVAILGAVLGLLLPGGGVDGEPVARSGLVSTYSYATGNSVVSTSAITIGAAGFGWGATDLATADRAYITSFTAGTVIRWDSSSPSTTLGMLVTQNATVLIEGGDNIRNLQFIRSGASDSTVSVVLERY